MGITLTDTALKEVRRILEAQQKSTWGLRVGVTDGGCSGMSYVMDIEEGPKPGDYVFDCGGIQVFCDPKSYLFISGLIIDFSAALLNGGFKFTNPNAFRTCSCGTSFSTGKNSAVTEPVSFSCRS